VLLSLIDIVFDILNIVDLTKRYEKQKKEIAKYKSHYEQFYSHIVATAKAFKKVSGGGTAPPSGGGITPPSNNNPIVFNKFPEGTQTSHGAGWNLGMPNGQRQMDSDYKITHVKVSLKWKDQGWGGEFAALNLWRGIFRPSGREDRAKGDHVIATLNLVHYNRSQDKNGINTVEKVITRDDGSFWKQGAKGEWINLYYNIGGSGCAITFHEMKVQVFLETSTTAAAATAAML